MKAIAKGGIDGNTQLAKFFHALAFNNYISLICHHSFTAFYPLKFYGAFVQFRKYSQFFSIGGIRSGVGYR
jgi:hypothetical protein